MSEHDEDRPVAVRAAAFRRQSRWSRRPRRVVRYDALWRDGRIRLDVDLTEMMYRGHPADFQPVQMAVRDACPEDGVGRWVDGRGAVIDGPGPPDPSAPGVRGGRPQAYRPSSREPRAATSRAWRLGAGMTGLAVGVPLVAGATGDGVGALAGALLCLFGAALLTGLRRTRG